MPLRGAYGEFMHQLEPLRPLRYRTIWISDVHLGLRGCQAETLLDFLRATSCRKLYLVGDIIDFWAMKKGLYWPETHAQVVRCILDKARSGTEVIYVPGNHDELLRQYVGLSFERIALRAEAVHLTADGRRLLVLHGDRFDRIIQEARWLALLGSHAYDVLLALNHRFNKLRRWWGLDYWSLAGFLKRKIKKAVNYIGRFERAVAAAARSAGVDGIVCGHIHHAELYAIADIGYCNCGDWVESCTALVEHGDGRLELLRWAESRQVARAVWAPRPALAQAS